MKAAQAARRLRCATAASRRCLSSSSAAYDRTISHLDVGKNTRVIFQGFTGKAATANAKDTIAYGTNIVGGVSPGKGGRTHLDLPVFDSVREVHSPHEPHTHTPRPVLC
jgi:succinyl-CoA synthetase alpha subunit